MKCIDRHAEQTKCLFDIMIYFVFSKVRIVKPKKQLPVAPVSVTMFLTAVRCGLVKIILGEVQHFALPEDSSFVVVDLFHT